MGVDLSGKVFGKLLVLHKIGVDKNRRVLWECLCNCGNKNISPTRYLIRGSRKDCGCGKLQRNILMGESRRKPELPQIIAKIRDGYIQNAKKKNLKFSLTDTLLYRLITSNCFYCDTLPTAIKKLRNVQLKWNGIDRLDNQVGYEVDNCVTCCSDCNYLKNKLNYTEFKNKVYLIARTLKGRE